MQSDIDAAAKALRERNRLPEDVPITVILGGDTRTAYVMPEGARKFEDGGTLDLGIFRQGVRRWPYLARRVRRWPLCAWGWLRYGWRD